MLDFEEFNAMPYENVAKGICIYADEDTTIDEIAVFMEQFFSHDTKKKVFYVCLSLRTFFRINVKKQDVSEIKKILEKNIA